MDIKGFLKHDLLTVKDAAHLIGVTPQTIRNWYSSGKIKKYVRKRRNDAVFVSKEEILTMNEIEESIGV